MSYISVDVEADNDTPYNGSIVCIGAVLVKHMDTTLYLQMAPITDKYNEDNLAISGFSREEHEKFPDPAKRMRLFFLWVKDVSKGQPIFIADNPAFDFAWVNYYFHKFIGKNPFGYSARRIGDLYCGLMKDSRARWKHLRKTKHTHNPVDDAKGNAEVLLYMRDKMNLKIKF